MLVASARAPRHPGGRVSAAPCRASAIFPMSCSTAPRFNVSRSAGSRCRAAPSAVAYSARRWQCPSVYGSRASTICPSIVMIASVDSSSSVSCFTRRSERTRVRSSCTSTGLPRKSSAPASMPARRWLRSWLAVTSTTGIRRVLPRAFSSRHNSTPDMPGITTSTSTRSGGSSETRRQCIGAVVGDAHVVAGGGQKVAHAVGVRSVIIDNNELAERFHLLSPC